jgi:hypothetical protein
MHKRHDEASNFTDEEVVAKIGIHTKDCSKYNWYSLINYVNSKPPKKCCTWLKENFD